jgi:hypothetical protein
VPDRYFYNTATSLWVWSGYIPGYDFSSVVFVFGSPDEMVTGRVYIPTTYPRNDFTVNRVPGDSTGLHILREIDPQRQPGDPLGD